MLYNIVSAKENKVEQSPQIKALAKVLFAGYDFIPTEMDNELDIKYVVNLLSHATSVNDVILINMKDFNRMDILDALQQRGIRAVVNLEPEELLMSTAWDDIRRLISICEMPHNNLERRLLDAESIIDIITGTALKVEREELPYQIEILIEEMARKALKEVMTSK